MTFIVRFAVDTDPVGKQRARHRFTGKFVQTYTPTKTRTYETLIRDEAIKAMGSTDPLETPVKLVLYIRAPIPKSTPKKLLQGFVDGLVRPTKKPDASNVLKSVEDAMNGVVYKDDCQIVDIHVRKVYSTTPGIDVVVMESLD